MRVGSFGRDFWAAAVLLAASVCLVVYIVGWESGTAAFGVSPRTLPLATAIMIAGLALALMVTSALDASTAARSHRADAEQESQAGSRVAVLLASSVAYVAAMTWIGYFAASVLFVGWTALLFGNRRPFVILTMMLLAPFALKIFFEKFMVILLPGWRLGG